ncbi:MAG: 50S ribosomal protein L13 [Chloroflexi bacterium]|nr:50S ribosomal protein L13 [Chloroflexota bacterium]
MVIKLKPYNPSASDMDSGWQVIDADDKILGRLATEIAWKLMGKDKPGYVPYLLSGDYVVVINAEKIKITGKKAEQKEYIRHSQYPGNRKVIPYGRMQAQHPDRIIIQAVKGMLPRTKLGRKMLGRMKVYKGPEHPHAAQIIGTETTSIASGDA